MLQAFIIFMIYIERMIKMENGINNIKIKVLGIGGGGNNAVNRIVADKVQNIETYIINTETKILQRSSIKNTLQIGKETTKGLGAGANPEIGEKSALESKEEIKQILKDTDLVFLTAGMGGGKATGEGKRREATERKGNNKRFRCWSKS